MNIRFVLLPALLAVATASGCGQHNNNPVASKDKTESTPNININGVSLGKDGKLELHSKEGGHSASLSVDGGLSIDGEPLQLDAAQRQLVLQYRQRINEIADQGIEVGKQGAALGVQAAGEALKGILNGDTDQIEAKVEAQAEQIKQQALKLCDGVEALRIAQNNLASAVPQFQPYASLDTDSVEECRQQ